MVSLGSMALESKERRAFPIIFASDVSRTAHFYERLGFARQGQQPATGEPSYVGLRRDTAELTVVDAGWPEQQYHREVGAGPRFEMFVMVDEVDAAIERLRADGVPVLREPVDLPWGARVGYVADPDDNPVAIASAATTR